jgi:hypothetical protein
MRGQFRDALARAPGFTLIVVATPGAGVLYTLAAGVSRGWQASLVAAFACTLGIVPHMIAAVTGLAAIMHASAVPSRSSSGLALPTRWRGGRLRQAGVRD